MWFLTQYVRHLKYIKLKAFLNFNLRKRPNQWQQKVVWVGGGGAGPINAPLNVRHPIR